MEKLFFAADAHFFHKNILNLDPRPFASLDDMHESIVARWNEIVGLTDKVWFLGDLAYRVEDMAALVTLYARLNGRIHMVWGNHDRRYARRLHEYKQIHFESAHDLTEIKFHGQRITLCHYAMRVWPGSHKGAWHLYGHSHGKLPEHGASLDVGLPCWGYRPVSFERIEALLKDRLPTQHHPEALEDSEGDS